MRNTRTGGTRKRVAGETKKGATPKEKGSASKVITSDKLPNGKRNNYKPQVTPGGPVPRPSPTPEVIQKAQRPNSGMVSKPAVKAPVRKSTR